jgi:hypothetical protein
VPAGHVCGGPSDRRRSWLVRRGRLPPVRSMRPVGTTRAGSVSSGRTRAHSSIPIPAIRHNPTGYITSKIKSRCPMGAIRMLNVDVCANNDNQQWNERKKNTHYLMTRVALPLTGV